MRWFTPFSNLPLLPDKPAFVRFPAGKPAGGAKLKQNEWDTTLDRSGSGSSPAANC